jgi:peroxiredoxin
MAALSSGTRAPLFALPDMNGKSVSLAEELRRGPVVLVFFKISCPVCQYALPILERLHKTYPNATIYGVSQNSLKDTERFRRDFRITYPVLLDDAKTYTASNAYGLTNVPSIFYIAPDGEIEVSCVGWSRKDVEEIGRKLSASQKAPVAPLFEPGEQVSDFRAG